MCFIFSRAVVSKKPQRICSRNQNCEINQGNRSCKACRWMKCLANGMSPNAVQPSRDPLGPKQKPLKPAEIEQEPKLDDPTTTSSTSTSPSTIFNSIDCEPDQVIGSAKLKVLDRMHRTFKEYEKSERALYALLFPEFNEPEYRLTVHTDYIKMERGCVQLMLTMIQEWVPSIAKMNHDTKWKIIRNFYPHFSPMFKLYRTSVVFPNQNDYRVVLAHNMYVDTRNETLNYHFRDSINPEEATRHCEKFHTKIRSLTLQFVELGITKLETIGLAGLCLANELEMLIGGSEEISKFRDNILNDLHLLIEKQTKSSELAATRIGTLICFLYDINLVRVQIDDTVTLLKLFSPHRAELWDDI
ncbi:Protein ultraspiracle [Aphelenchoides besseyi]|nr:Protein ultraspiracle [Aphelenchoides besseyi]